MRNACAVADSLVQTASYSLPPTLPLRHALWQQCNGMLVDEATSGRNSQVAQQTKFLVFKVARSGSTFLTETLDLLLSDAQIVFEPFGRVACYQRISSGEQESCLRNLLQKQCAPSTPPNRSAVETLVNLNWFCSPCSGCNGVDVQRAGVILNARFVDHVQWRQFWGLPIKIVNLRRTNLVRMSVSKLEHSGLAPSCGHGCVHRRGNASAFFVFQMLDFSRALTSFVIDDQEFGSAVAYSSPPSIPKLLVLYEDLAGATKVVVLEQVLRFLGYVVPSSTSKSAPRASLKKLHSNFICSAIENCVELHQFWQQRYPCLAGQLMDRSDLAWSMPITNSGLVHIRGHCSQLAPLQPSAPRSLEQLYDISADH